LHAAEIDQVLVEDPVEKMQGIPIARKEQVCDVAASNDEPFVDSVLPVYAIDFGYDEER